LLNSRLGLFAAAPLQERPFSRSYGAILPSSLAVSLSSALGYSPGAPVSVCGTGRHARFSWDCRGGAIGSAGALPYSRRGLQRAIPSARGRSGNPSLPSHGGCRNVRLLCIGCPEWVRLSPRLTLGRLALPRNPCPCGVQVSRLHCRYLCLHLLFRALHRCSRTGFAARGMLPYRSAHKRISRGFGSALDARLSSARCRSTSELLRTL
jgi:hypothetical protein